MSEKKDSPAKNKLSPDWLVRGVLAKLGDTFDKFLGRDWKPSSSLATSELIERLKRLLDQEVKDHGEKGRFVPHNIKLKMQWDKFSTDAEEAMRRLENELLAAAIDHINDRRYHTYAPLNVQAKPDYFTDGVKLWASFDEFGEDEKEAELDVAVPKMNVETFVPPEPAPEPETENFTAAFTAGEKQKSVELKFTKGRRLSVGRTKENNLSLDDISVSKNHATLAVSPEGKLLVADTGSTNGTFINDERIAYGRALEVGEADRVKFGEIEVFFRPVPKAAGFVTTDSDEDEDTQVMGTRKSENHSASNGAVKASADEKSEISEAARTESGVKLDLGEGGGEREQQIIRMFYLFLLQFDWQKLRPENLLGGQILERTPAGLTLIYLAGIAVLLVLLGLSFFRTLRPKFAFERDLPDEVKRKLGKTIADRSLRIWQFVFVFLALFVYGFHVYWTAYADESNQEFQALSYKDLRNRRTSASTLRGWMLDRSGKLSNALAYYKREQDGDIVRAFALEKEMAHLLGTERGTPGLERTLYRQQAEPMPETWEVFTRIKRPEDEQRDVKVTIDRDLQAFLAEQLEGKKGAVVVLNPQTGDLLAMYSNPSFNLAEAQTLDDYLKLEGNRRDKPLLNRAMREYYVPGSTFKTFTMIAAFRAGRQNTTFTSTPGGFAPYRNSRPITDANGGCEPPYGCTTLNITQAFEVSSNQYFSQMAVALGRERLRETAGVFGIAAVETPQDALTAGLFPDIWNASNQRIQNAIAPQQSTLVTGKDITTYDIGLEGMGQGYAGQMTPFQMALIVSAGANLNGNLMKPRIELNQPPQAFSQILTPQQAAQVREIMGTVTEGTGGTGTRVFAEIRAQGIRTGGKTGTAEKKAPVYDEKTGKLKTYTVKDKDKNGNVIERVLPQLYDRTDSWYVSIAPLENPQLAIAVVVEAGGFGATTAAPIAARVILKARELGLLGDQYKPKNQMPNAPNAPKQPAKRNRTAPR